jgi:hypothetical protein
VRSLLLSEISSLDDIDLTTRQLGDLSHGVRIPGTGGASVKSGTDSAHHHSKGKGKVTPIEVASRSGSWPQLIDVEVSSEDDAPPT